MNNENFNKRPAQCLPTSDLGPLVLILARVASPESEYHTTLGLELWLTLL